MVKQYLELSKKILSEGEYEWNERTKTGTISLFGEAAKYDLREGFPIPTTKKFSPRLPFEEMLFFLRGDSDVKELIDRNVNIWNGNAFDYYLRRHDLNKEFPKHTREWRDKFSWYVNEIKTNENFLEDERTLGRIYGVQARNWIGADGKVVDQFSNFINKLKKDPTSRSNIVSHFNPAEMNQMALGPCHLLYQSRVIEQEDGKNRLDLLMFQRSCDTLLGVPFNQAQYSFLIELAAKEADLVPGNFSHLFGNLHFYTGVGERAEFLRKPENMVNFQEKVKRAKAPEDFLEVMDWYLKTAPREPEGTEGTDHTPFILNQLSRDTKNLPTLEFKVGKEIDIWNSIEMKVEDLLEIKDYYKSEPVDYILDGQEIKPVMAT